MLKKVTQVKDGESFILNEVEYIIDKEVRVGGKSISIISINGETKKKINITTKVECVSNKGNTVKVEDTSNRIVFGNFTPVDGGGPDETVEIPPTTDGGE